MTIVKGPATAKPQVTPGAADGFAELYAAHVHSLTVQLFAYTGDLAVAEDLVHEAFCRALSRWSRVRVHDNPVAWVRLVAWNLARNRWRRLRVAADFLRRQRVQAVEGPGPDRVALAAALAQLPPRQRRAVILYYLADLPIAEIAQQENVAPGTVKSWLHRGRTALASHLRETGKETGDD
ncbi:SigE family RNA polymerase sigma factor [Phytohabitans houttuyneae]|uniref:RNA polymerase sigma24 factor n=1 Tax=Phytohabitans houttuyneae TaxID=1076126 RepID=A0A6V8KGX2_9ACTN|nr:RNA polymerase sigma24 factor [Phytohabitans houttuyneae]